MRNAKADLRICNAATPGPWYREKTGATFKGFSTETVIADTATCCTGNKIYASSSGGSYPDSDADFIALARDALPYWINRAQELEKALEQSNEFLTDDHHLDLDAAFEEIEWLYEEYGIEEDEKLSQDAVKLKQKVLGFVDDIIGLKAIKRLHIENSSDSILELYSGIDNCIVPPKSNNKIGVDNKRIMIYVYQHSDDNETAIRIYEHSRTGIIEPDLWLD